MDLLFKTAAFLPKVIPNFSFYIILCRARLSQKRLEKDYKKVIRRLEKLEVSDPLTFKDG